MSSTSNRFLQVLNILSRNYYRNVPEVYEERTNSLSFLGRIAYFGSLAAILLVAIPHGTVEPWQKGLFVVMVSVLGVLRVSDGLINSDFRIAEPRLLMPLLGILGLASIQLIPLSAGEPITLDPYQTQSFIVVFASVIVFAELLFNFSRDERRLQQLVIVVLAVALGSAIFGLVRETVWDSSGLFAPTGSLPTEQSYAQFINRNHFALLAEMGLGLLLGVLLKGELRPKWRLLGYLGFAFLVYSIIASNSRGGLASLTGMAVFGVFVHIMTRAGTSHDPRVRKRQGHPRFLKKILTAACLCLLTFGIIVLLVAFIGGDAVVTRIEQIDREVDTTQTSRVNRAMIWESSFELIKEHPVFGTGFGAFGAAITRYDSANGHFLLEQAHNDYLEIVVNGGAVGALLFLVLAILVGARMTNNLLSSDGFRRASCFGSIVAVLGVLIHSFVDFGLHVLVNALVCVALIVIGTARIERPIQRTRRGQSSRA